MNKSIALIMTVLNEENSLPNLLKDISTQTKTADEIIIVDAGSKDKTKEILNEYAGSNKNVKIFIYEKINRSTGRNIAIRNSCCNIIAVTDGGVRLDPKWLEHITFPLLNDNNIDVVTGMTLSNSNSFYDKCLAAIIVHNKEELLGKGFLSILYYKYIYRRRFGKSFPSSRSISFRKIIWEKAGGYPEAIEVSEDMAFNFRLIAVKAKFVLNNNAIAYWSPLRTPIKSMKYFFYNAIWDAKAKIFISRSILKIFAYVFGAGIIIFYRNNAIILVLLSSTIYFIYFLQPSIISLKNTKNIFSLIITPVILIFKDISQNMGFVIGLISNIFKKARLINL